MSGLDVNRARIAAFTLGGFFAACGGLFLAIQTSSGNADIPQAGAYTLNSIASVVIGGTSLLGGSGGAIGSVFGAMILRVISFFFRIFDIAPLLQPLFEGIILLAAVSIGSLRVLQGQEHAGALPVTALPVDPHARRATIGRSSSRRCSSSRSSIAGTAYTLAAIWQRSAACRRTICLQQLQIGAFLGIVAAGMMIVILISQIDLSVPWTLTAAR